VLSICAVSWSYKASEVGAFGSLVFSLIFLASKAAAFILSSAFSASFWFSALLKALKFLARVSILCSRLPAKLRLLNDKAAEKITVAKVFLIMLLSF